MTPTLEREHQEKRDELLTTVAAIKDTLEANIVATEDQSTLAEASVAALHQSGLLALKLPRELGGIEADPVTQSEVIEAVSRIHPSAGWCLMIGATSIGLPGAFLSDESVSQIFSNDQIPRASTSFVPTGRGVPVDGGYRVEGRWPFASGVRHADWVNAGILIIDGDGGHPEHRLATLPSSQIQIHDNWNVLGLQGTGSCDFSASDVFVPKDFTWNIVEAQAKRGGPLYHLGLPGFFANEHAAFALGVASRALDEIVELAKSKRRGLTPNPSLLAERPAFQRQVSESHLKLRGARAVVIEILEQAWDSVAQGNVPSPQLQSEMRSSATYATDVALEITTAAFRYAGGAALPLPGTLQQCLRDLNAAAQHVMVSDITYETHGKFLLGLPDVNPMT